MVVLPASSSSVQPPSGSSATAARAIRSFSSAWAWSRSGSWASSIVTDRIETAPPCTRRSSLSFSSWDRSRRTVSVVTSKWLASSVTATRPRLATSSAMAWCRSSAYMACS